MDAADDTVQDVRDGLKRYEERTQRYEEQPEQWKQDHDAAMRCFDFEGLLALGLSLFDFINRVDEAWRVKVYRGLVPYDATMDQVIEGLYRVWLRPCDRLHARLAELEKHFDVKGASEFRAACREVQGILTRDDEFFTGDRLAELRDEAVEDHRAGSTEDMGSVGH